MKKRLLALFLTLSLMIPCLAIPTSAVLALPGGVAAGATAPLAIPALSAAASAVVGVASEVLGISKENVQPILDYLVSIVGYGNLGHEGLESACNRLNQIAANPSKYASNMYKDMLGLGLIESWVTEEQFYKVVVYITAYENNLVGGWHTIDHQDYGRVIVNEPETFILSNSIGQYPYAEEITDMWMPESHVMGNKVLHIATEYMLNSLEEQQKELHPSTSIRQVVIRFGDGVRYKVLKQDADGVVGAYILCDEDGFPYGIPQDSTQMGSDRDYNNDKDDQPEVSDEPIVDIDGDLVMQMFPDGSFTWINQLIYDASNKTYNVTSNTTYNNSNNTTFNYTWNYTYHIDYTSITYIGQTEEYTETYEYYYNLPDGRSSADLTAEELLALNTKIDVIPYIRSADDVSIRALYHFDADTLDSSYWSHLGELKWQEGASLTYMDAGAFNGALYLDENAHNFTVTLPSDLLSSDFTVQFRYYQSHTPTPVEDASVSFSGVKFLRANGASWMNSLGTVIAPVSVGSWQEVCLMRRDGVLYYFINGVCVNQLASTRVLGDELAFSFGSEQQTYKYFDELRVTSKALYPSSGYTPTSVPFDTNLSLVLPDSQIPVADEYWSFTSSGTNLLTDVGLDCWAGESLPGFTVISNAINPANSGANWTGGYAGIWEYPEFGYNSLITTVNAYAHSMSLISNSYTNGGYALPIYQVKSSATGAYYRPTYGIHTVLAYNDETYLAAGEYTFSMVDMAGNVGSFAFTMPSSVGSKAEVLGVMEFNGYRCSVQRYRTSSSLYAIYLSIQPMEKDVENQFAYLELVEGSSTDLTAEFVQSVVAMDKDDLNTPTLAVRTDLTITGYQLGGVRPSLPEKGLVWALIEGGRITSLQIYNGQAWESVDGRIWTGSRWVPYYAYDVLLLKDLYDIVEGDPSLDFIYTEQGFWSWLQQAWEQMIARLDAILSALGGDAVNPDGSTSVPDSSTLPGEEDDPTTEEDEGWVFIDLLVILRDGVWKVATGVVRTGVNGISGLADGIGSIGGFFDIYDPDTSGGVLDILNQGGSAVWE